MELGKIIAVNLKELRRERNLTLGQLSKMSGISKAMLSDIESIASKMETDLTLKNNILNLLNDTKLSVAIDYGTGNGGN